MVEEGISEKKENLPLGGGKKNHCDQGDDVKKESARMAVPAIVCPIGILDT